MKKIYTLLLVALFSVGAMAQHEIGAVVGGLNGLSYKYWFSDNLAVQADLAVGLTKAVVGNGNGSTSAFNQYDFTLNPNMLYHIDLPSNFKIYFGGGVGIGILSALDNTDPNLIWGKFGVNGTVGTCYQFSGAPVALALDFRPGYGMGFYETNLWGVSNTTLMHMFDWKLALAVRYCL